MVAKKPLHIAIVDNYDSFVFNIVHYLEAVADAVKITVIKNDEIDESILQKADALVLSPEPGIPSEAGDLLNIIDKYHKRKPILGICLGLQALVEYFGGKLINLSMPLHGITTQLHKTAESKLWQTIEFPSPIGHYHSWAASKENFPKSLEITAENSEGQIMAIQHKILPIVALQFHPESILTTQGKTMLRNWIKTIETTDGK
ncbi:aminodeoxychorismate/anthranilate synthase component II [Capnocytophaga sp. ARDL2]|uniref:anthranilate synthase component II n=1 Tax=Capnocytophaga sp. ARDL2 TaxID=3238809 RepID=UPI0035578D59